MPDQNDRQRDPSIDHLLNALPGPMEETPPRSIRDTDLDTPPPTEPRVYLRDLEFTDLYFSEVGESFIRGVGDASGPLSHIPPDAVDDLDILHRLVCERGQRRNEFSVDFDGVRYRVAKIPSVTATWYALRRAKSPIPRFGSLGIPQRVVQYLGQLGRRHGLIVLSGATGNGKTTTASSLLQEYLIAYGDVGITIEDPPELPLEGQHGNFGRCFQIQVENGDFSSAMTSALRYNPRYILLGEIRTPKEASLALRAAINGHLVITTIHAGSVIETVNSLLKLVAGHESLDLSRQVLADGLAGVLHQTLVRVRDKQPRLQTQWLFPDKDNGIRSRIREGKVEQLITDIQRQTTRVMNGKLPVGED